MTGKVKAGIIGLGRLGGYYSQLIKNQVKHVDLLAACSLRQSELSFAKTELGVQYVYSDHQQIVQNHDIDAIFVFSPPAHHASQVIDAIEAGKHVFMSTPLAMNVADCQSVIKSAESRPSQTVMIGLEHRYDPAYIKTKELIAKGKIGEPIMIQSYTYDKEKTDTYYQQYAATSSGIFMELNLKNIDIIRWLTGKEIESVQSSGKSFKYDIFNRMNDADNAMSMLNLTGGSIANVMASRIAQDGFSTQTSILGTEGSIAIKDNTFLEAIQFHDTNGRKTLVPQTYFELFDSALLAQANDFVECILESKKPKSTLQDGLEATKVAVAMTKSFLLKDKVYIE